MQETITKFFGKSQQTIIESVFTPELHSIARIRDLFIDVNIFFFFFFYFGFPIPFPVRHFVSLAIFLFYF